MNDERMKWNECFSCDWQPYDCDDALTKHHPIQTASPRTRIMMFPIAGFLLACFLQTASVLGQCPPTGFDAVKQFALEKFVDEPWYSLRQLPVAYQPRDQFNCVFADYGIDTRKSFRCRVFGWAFDCNDPDAITVFNSARDGSATGRAVSVNFKATIPDPDNNPAKAYVGPKFLPNVLRQDTNYWVAAVGRYNELTGLGSEPDSGLYDWAIITTGAPESTGKNGLCYSNGGMWFFSRRPVPPNGTIAAMETIAAGLKLDTSVLEPVNQDGCDYSKGKGRFFSGFTTFFSDLF
jgi:apolipoprotein D and lipocalin family protein